MSVMTGLTNIAVLRVTKLWEDIPSKTKQKFDTYEEFINPMGGHKNYRNRLREISFDTPCIPYIALYLRDLTHICDGYKAYIQGRIAKKEKKKEVMESVETGEGTVGSDGSSESSDVIVQSKKCLGRKLVNVRRVIMIGERINEVRSMAVGAHQTCGVKTMNYFF